MKAPKSVCAGCGVELEGGALPYRGYYNCSAECWAAYTEILGREYQDAVLFGQVHQLTVDAYAVQHAGGPHPDKSVCVHLVGLHLVLERGLKVFEVPPRLQHLAASMPAWPHFEPPATRAATTVRDILQAPAAREHAAIARRWAEQVWRLWAPHREQVAQLAERCFAEARGGKARVADS